ncbi:FitA-like ribbon-helix-helix domain-containing protein [Sphingobium fluviale]|uniref:Plasmid stability protein y4jJ n=1 Tax=Sphingobium fluviale TaxID=2506423 RepID=A0A4Q1KEI9_9SPHN|nr:plasmid stability protein y4jJ [Sphingobium fluviale]RXR25994.1 plasmid stability protein y4jJ [Sphingobium fluviale]
MQRSRVIASVVVRNLSEETKSRLVARAMRNKHSLEEELRQILDATAHADAQNPDAQEPFGDWLVRITRPGYEDFADIMDRIVAERTLPDRPLPTFD